MFNVGIEFNSGWDNIILLYNIYTVVYRSTNWNGIWSIGGNRMWEMIKSLAYYTLFILATASILLLSGTALLFIFGMFLVLMGA